MTPFDLCILTAANDVQAEGYRIRLDWRKKNGLYPHTEFLVIADPAGRRIGSGGSTLHVLHHLYQLHRKKFNSAFCRKRILIIHSGGDSRRLPAYAACGKIFTPLPTKPYESLFDIMMDAYAALPPGADGQVLITSGDVLLSFSAEQIHFSDQGITGVAYPDDSQVASRHGVFVPERQAHQIPVRVKDFLQKPSLAELRQCHALDFYQRAWVDTGIVHLAPDAIDVLLSCSRLRSASVHQGKELNLYQEIPQALLDKLAIADGERLRSLAYHVSLLPYCGFFHIGRSREFLNNLYSLTHAGALYHFSSGVRSNAADYPQFKKAYIYNSLLSTRSASIKAPALIENCVLRQAVVLAGENILTNMRPEIGPVQLEQGLGLTLLPLKQNRWTAIIYGLEDHFKSGVEADQNLFMNQPIADWLRNRDLAVPSIWTRQTAGDLWQAQLFPVSQHPARAVRLALSLQAKGRQPKKWLAAERRSLQMILKSVDHKALLRQQQEIDKAAALTNLRQELLPDSNWTTQGLLSLCTKAADRPQLECELSQMAQQQADPLIRSRLFYLQSRLVRESAWRQPKRRAEADRLLDQAFSTIRLAVGRSAGDEPRSDHRGIAIRSDEVVWVRSSARLDFAGGWSDTPPYCMEQGGAVLNAAVMLNGQYPIQVIAKILNQPVVRINSIDLGASATFRDLSSLRDFSNPADWLSLPKAALTAAGIFSGRERTSLASLLKKFGGGIDLTLFSALPAGSGLGTSSILGAATIAALARMFGITFSRNELFQRTSYMEQLMTTGGGWQDQIGGVVGGVKLIQTPAGYDQTPTLSWTLLTEEDQSLALLYYTGLRRMAKNILRQVVSRYLDRDPEALATLLQLKGLAAEMKNALDHRQMDRFGDLISKVWLCNKRLDKGSTTDAIETLIETITPFSHGVKLLGAGGGGFLFIVAKSSRDRAQIRRLLESKPPNSRARFFDFAVDDNGLRVNVL